MLKFYTRSLLTIVYKKVFGTFLFCLEVDLITQIKKNLVSTHSQKIGLWITHDINNIKQITNAILSTLVRWKRMKKFRSKIWNSLVFGSVKPKFTLTTCTTLSNFVHDFWVDCFPKPKLLSGADRLIYLNISIGISKINSPRPACAP